LANIGLLALAAVTAGLVGYTLLPAGAAAPGPAFTTIQAPTPVATKPAVKAALAPLVVTRAGTAPLRVLFVGDSLTSGFFASTEAASFKAIMVARWGNVDQTTAAIARQTVGTVSSVTAVPENVDVAVVELGTNDVGKPTSLQNFTSEYVGLVAKIRTASPKGAIICAGTWTAHGDAYDQIISDACTQAGGRYVPLVALYDTLSFHGPVGVSTWRGESDAFHPNDAGHQAIAGVLLAAIHLK
jgi:acyl-CoA thioesterase I